MEESTTTVTGPRMWMIVGILAFIGVLLLLGFVVSEARVYVVDTVKILLGSLSAVNSLK